MPEKQAFYGFGNYLTDNGDTLGYRIVFVLAEDEKSARAMLVKEIYLVGEPVPGSLNVYKGSEIRVDWLMTAVTQSGEVSWSSGLSMPSIQAAAKPQTKEHLN